MLQVIAKKTSIPWHRSATRLLEMLRFSPCFVKMALWSNVHLEDLTVLVIPKGTLAKFASILYLSWTLVAITKGLNFDIKPVWMSKAQK